MPEISDPKYWIPVRVYLTYPICNLASAYVACPCSTLYNMSTSTLLTNWLDTYVCNRSHASLLPWIWRFNAYRGMRDKDLPRIRDWIYTCMSGHQHTGKQTRLVNSRRLPDYPTKYTDSASALCSSCTPGASRRLGRPGFTLQVCSCSRLPTRHSN